MNEEEEFFAWLDGELSGEEAERVAARVAASPELSARVEQHRKLAARLRVAFDPVMNEKVAPPSFQSAEVVDFDAKAMERGRRRASFAAPQWAAIAASLVVGVFAGQWLDSSNPDAPVRVESGRMIAASGLQQALDSQLASAPADEGVRVALTFRDGTGKICRSFTGEAATGLACRENGDWQVRGLFPTAEGQAGDFRMASGTDPRLASLIGETMAGEPFDATQERSARDAGWR